jgi:hypothetical protein
MRGPRITMLAICEARHNPGMDLCTRGAVKRWILQPKMLKKSGWLPVLNLRFDQHPPPRSFWSPNREPNA